MNLHYLYNKIVKEFFNRFPVKVFVTDDFVNEPPYYLIKRIDTQKYSGQFGFVLFMDQEPVYTHFIPWYKSPESTSIDYKVGSEWKNAMSIYGTPLMVFVSEHSVDVDRVRQRIDGTIKNCVVYYFYHALACLDNYREYWKQDIVVPDQHKYLFICYQHVVNSYRWHRIRFQQNLVESGLIDQGLVSYFPPEKETLVNIIKESTSKHGSQQAEIDALAVIDQLVIQYKIDTDSPTGSMSTFIDIEACQSALIHVVSETAFYNGKLHLTEKIFKPIVAKQPFLLLGAHGNLKYFKQYGFKTFSEFWDESYDDIVDDNERVDAVFNILTDLSKLSYEEQCALRQATKEIVEYNWHHFYYNLRDIVIDELTDNLQSEIANSSMWKHHIKSEHIGHLNNILKF